MSESLSAFLLDHPAADDDPIVHWIEGSVDLGELREASERAATVLHEAGVGADDPVAVVIDSGVSALAALFGTWRAGAAAVPINGRLTDAEIDKQLATAAPAAVITARESLRTPGAATILATGALEWSADGRATTHHPLPAGTALVMRTSGTTGESKPIVLSHAGVRDGIDTSLAALRGKRDGGRPRPTAMPNLIPSSLALWAGLWNALFALRSGAPLVLMDRFDAVDFATLVRRHDIRSAVLAPAMMAMLVDEPTVTDLAPLRMVRSITAPLTPGQARAFSAKFAIGILNCYGQTELGGEVVGWNAADLREYGESKLGAVGRPHDGIDVRILDRDHLPVPEGTVGEIWIASPYVSTAAEITAALIDGYLRTGDLGRVDAEGFLWIVGRVSDTINRGGLKVVPQEVEDALRALPGVADACVAGVPDERLGEVPVAWVRVEPGAMIEGPSLLAALRETLAGYKVPVAVEVVEDFPRNEIGKVLRKELVSRWTA
ncbi:MAG TPA: class I adenylate-forming enzyme family protein [Mycobacteriales bacterium]|nr:class I adenylate-forming enzyme family protein [Mycobacteriales bacterium]